MICTDTTASLDPSLILTFRRRRAWLSYLFASPVKQILLFQAVKKASLKVILYGPNLSKIRLGNSARIYVKGQEEAALQSKT